MKQKPHKAHGCDNISMAMLKKLTGVKKINKKSPAFEIRLPDTNAHHIGDKIVLETETANEAVNTKWFRNGGHYIHVGNRIHMIYIIALQKSSKMKF